MLSTRPPKPSQMSAFALKIACLFASLGGRLLAHRYAIFLWTI